MTANKKEFISVAERSKRLDVGVGMFHQHLIDAPSICLPADFRWAVAYEARACLTCSGCAAIKGKSCKESDGCKVYSLMKSEQHSSGKDIPFAVSDRSSWDKVRTLVHFVIHHPNSADKGWYESTIKSLGHASLVKKNVPEDQRQRLIETLFAEILGTVLASHAIHVLYLSLGKDVPHLPPCPDSETQTRPTFQDVVTAGMLKKGKTFRHDPKVSHVPFVTNKEINFNSEAFQAYAKDVQEYLKDNMTIPHPLSVLTIAPATFALCGMVIGGKISLPESVVGAPWKRLDPTKYCTMEDGGFSRLEWETINLCIAEEYQTEFCRTFHEAVRLGVGGKMAKTDRELLLILLTQGVLKKPQSADGLENIIDRVKKEFGESTLVESAASIAYGEAYCKASHVSGLVPAPRPVLFIVPKVVKLMRVFSSAA